MDSAANCQWPLSSREDSLARLHHCDLRVTETLAQFRRELLVLVPHLLLDCNLLAHPSTSLVFTSMHAICGTSPAMDDYGLATSRRYGERQRPASIRTLAVMYADRVWFVPKRA